MPAPPRRIFAFAVSALLLGIAAAVWLELPSGPLCHAILTARTTHVTATSAGRIAEVTVEEGSEVRIGDPIMRIHDESLGRSILAKKREIASLESKLQQSLASAELELNWRLRTLESEICDIQLRSASFLKEKYNFELQRSMLSDVLAGRDFAMIDDGNSLFDSMVVNNKINSSQRMATVLEMELVSNAAEVSSAQVEICELRQKQLLDLKESLPLHIRKTQGVDVAEAELARAEAELDQLLAQETELTIVSPAIGRVGVFKCRSGDQVEPGTALVELLDDSKRYLVVYVPSKNIPSFELGTKVELTFPGNDFYSGVVSSVAPQAKPCLIAENSTEDTTVLVQVEQTGHVWPSVPIGSQVMVRVSEKQ